MSNRVERGRASPVTPDHLDLDDPAPAGNGAGDPLRLDDVPRRAGISVSTFSVFGTPCAVESTVGCTAPFETADTSFQTRLLARFCLKAPHALDGVLAWLFSSWASTSIATPGARPQRLRQRPPRLFAPRADNRRCVGWPGVSDRGDRGPERQFDPARANRLDAPERDIYLPDAPLLALLELHGGETVLDYGAGTGRLAIAVRTALGAGGRVIAVDENEEMVARLRERVVAAGAQVETAPIESNRVSEADGAVDRVLAVNLLHEVHGERALEEMRRLLAPDGLLLVADWERGRDPERALGPPDEILYSEQEAASELERAGFEVERHTGQRWHFMLVGRPRA